MPKSFNVVLFGETGVGKSSLVNLISGEEVAPTSGNSNLCTLSFAPYHFQIDNVPYTIWDTRGFDEADTQTGTKEYLDGIEQAHKLIQSLAASEGVDLLVLCHREGRITTTTQSNYRLFYEVLCEAQVPVALAITYLEHHTRMEDWWDQNKEIFERRQIRVTTHACVTGLPGHPRSQESKRAIESMLSQFDEGRKYHLSAEEWFRRFLLRWPEFRRPPKGLTERGLEIFLREQCRLSGSDVHDIARTLCDSDDSRKGFFGVQYSVMRDVTSKLRKNMFVDCVHRFQIDSGYVAG